MKTKWKIIIPIVIVAALAAAFFLQGNDAKAPSTPLTIETGPVTVTVDTSVDPVKVDVVNSDVKVETGEVKTDAEPVAPVEIDVNAEAAEAVSADTNPEPVEPVQTETDVAVSENIVPLVPGEETVLIDNGPVAIDISAENSSAENTEAPDASPESITPEETPAPMTVTISINCATINGNLSDLDPAKTSLVPSDGWLLKAVAVPFNEGESVFNVLQRVCKQNKIHMEFMNTPVYNSAYIEGIGNLYEFDCGPLSGWMYSVNDWYPNYGCSRYELKAGDVICWRYTCDLGADIGGGYIDNLQKDD